MSFLQNSHFYTPQRILPLLDDHLIEEKAIVFGRLKRHREALLIYTQILSDFEAAELHCLKVYKENDPIDREVFFEFYQVHILNRALSNLFKVCIDPKACINPGSTNDAFNVRLLAKHPRPHINEALNILRNHSTKLDTIKAIHLIPTDAPLNKVFVALEAVLESIKNRVSSVSSTGRQEIAVHLSERHSSRHFKSGP